MTHKPSSGWNDKNELRCLVILKKLQAEKFPYGRQAQLCREMAGLRDVKLSQETISARVGNFKSVAGINNPSKHSEDTERIYEKYKDRSIEELERVIAGYEQENETAKAEGKTVATTEKLLKDVGKRTFINCFEALKEKGGGRLSQEEVLKADYPDSADWGEPALRSKTSTFNRMIGERREYDALRICCEAQKIGRNMQQKAKELHNKYCNSNPNHNKKANEMNYETMKQSFQNWMRKQTFSKREKHYSKTTIYNYSMAIDKISKHYSEKEGESIDIYTVKNGMRLRDIASLYDIGGKYEDFGDCGHGRNRAAIKKYVKFRETNHR